MKQLYINILCVAAALPALTSCDHDVDMVSLGIDDVYYVERMRKLPLHSA